MLRHSLLQNYQNSPDKVCCPFPQRWTSVGSAGCNTARLQVTQGHQSQHGLTVQGNAAFPWGTSQGASAGTQQLPQGPEWCPGQHSPGSLSLLMGSSAHGVSFSIPDPQICVSDWILQGSVHHECNPKRQQLPRSWVILRKPWIEAWQEHSPMSLCLWLSGGLREAQVPAWAAPAPFSSSSSRFQTCIC